MNQQCVWSDSCDLVVAYLEILLRDRTKTYQPIRDYSTRFMDEMIKTHVNMASHDTPGKTTAKTKASAVIVPRTDIGSDKCPAG